MQVRRLAEFPPLQIVTFRHIIPLLRLPLPFRDLTINRRRQWSNNSRSLPQGSIITLPLFPFWFVQH